MTESLIATFIHDRYQLTEVLGQGGMGVVYKAIDKRLSDRPCAVKLLLRSFDDVHLERFKSELDIISRIRSPHVVQVTDTGYMPDGRLFIVMEMLDGAPLSKICKDEGPLSVERVFHIIRGVSAGLSEAHNLGIIHRDLKPANIFITKTVVGDEIAKVLDFGIAKNINRKGGDALTSDDVIIGTPKYMAPEQLQQQQTDPRTDVYALGLLMYQMLSGESAFDLNHPELPDNLKSMPADLQVAWLHLNVTPRPFDIHPLLWDLIEKMVAKDPKDRPSSMVEVAERIKELQGTLSGELSLAQTKLLRQAPPPSQATKVISGAAPKIFISYRRDDKMTYAQLLSSKIALDPCFDPELIFLDVEEGGIPLGVNFAEYIDAKVRECDLLLVMIGAEWERILLERRNVTDYVRIEISVALEQKKVVIPILLEDTPMPREELLPDDLKSLVMINATRLRSMDIVADSNRLIEAIKKRFNLKPLPSRTGSIPSTELNEALMNEALSSKEAPEDQTLPNSPPPPYLITDHSPQAPQRGRGSALMKALIVVAVTIIGAVVLWLNGGGHEELKMSSQAPRPNSIKASIHPSKLTYSINDIIQLKVEIRDMLGEQVSLEQLPMYQLTYHSNKPSVKLDEGSAILKGTGRAIITVCLKTVSAVEPHGGQSAPLCDELDVMVIDEDALPF